MKHQLDQNALTAYALIEALGVLNTRQSYSEIIQIAKNTRPNLYRKEEVLSISSKAYNSHYCMLLAHQVAGVLTVMMQHILYKWPKDALSIQDKKFYQEMRNYKEAMQSRIYQQPVAGDESPQQELPPRDISITIYNPHTEAVRLMFRSKYVAGDIEQVSLLFLCSARTEILPLQILAEGFLSFMVRRGDRITLLGPDDKESDSVIDIEDRPFHARIDARRTGFDSFQFKEKPLEPVLEYDSDSRGKGKEKELDPPWPQCAIGEERKNVETEDWQSDLVGDWIASLNLSGDYTDFFKKKNITGEKLLNLQTSELQDLGM